MIKPIWAVYANLVLNGSKKYADVPSKDREGVLACICVKCMQGGTLTYEQIMTNESVDDNPTIGAGYRSKTVVNYIELYCKKLGCEYLLK